MAISERIRSSRKAKNISQVELSELSGVSTKSLSRYELGTSIPPADNLKLIADVLGVSTDYLLGEENTTIKDKELMHKFEVIQDMNGEDRKLINKFLDLAIRDYKARQAYAS